MAEDRILTIPQAAELLQMHYESVRRLVLTGKIPGRKLGGTWRIVESDLKRWITAGQVLQAQAQEDKPLGF